MNPLSHDEIHLLDSTLLPVLERHHLRLLAHALRTLQQVQADCGSTALPDAEAIERWLLQQPSLNGEPDFSSLLAAQLHSAGKQLQRLAAARGLSPLELELDDLIAWSLQQADQRLASEAAAP